MDIKMIEMGLSILRGIGQEEMRLQSYIDETRGKGIYRDERLVARQRSNFIITCLNL